MTLTKCPNNYTAVHLLLIIHQTFLVRATVVKILPFLSSVHTTVHDGHRLSRLSLERICNDIAAQWCQGLGGYFAKTSKQIWRISPK